MANFMDNVLQSYDLIKRMVALAYKVEESADILVNSIKNGGTIYIIGNGGSAADSSHFAGELLGRFKLERKGLPCITLTTDMATITAIANDYGFEQIFKRQLEGLFNPEKDILIALSTSGNSGNIINSLNYINDISGHSIVLLGRDGGEIASEKEFVNEHHIIIPAQGSDRIQEMHMLILHYFAERIEEECGVF